MAITLTRTSTPRFGSRNWAKAQTSPWTAERATWSDGGDPGWEIKVGTKLIAVVLDDLVGTRPDDSQQAYTLNYGGEAIGNALYGDLCEALEALADEDADDAEPITFVRA